MPMITSISFSLIMSISRRGRSGGKFSFPILAPIRATATASSAVVHVGTLEVY